jgi:Acetyl xylan esterase (AXE1)
MIKCNALKFPVMIKSMIRSLSLLKSTCRLILLLAVIMVLQIRGAGAQEEFDIVKNNWLRYSDAPNSLYHYMAGQAYEILAGRSAGVAKLKTLDDWQLRQKTVRGILLDIIGPFPEKTPLNAKIIRTIEKDGFMVEHIVYESQPGFYVTSSLFIPSGLRRGAKAPVVIYCSGHTEDGYRGNVYQHVILNLVKKNFIVFAFDPVGQGERLEYFDPETGKSIVGGPTTEHSYPGTQAFITGSSEARYMIWDGIRAVDYLLTRREVDPARIGITGRSGGGTQSAYISAMDDRIYAAAPECYITNFTRLLQSIGNQDAEQNLFNEISRGIDHADLLEVRAPKPALMITTTRDMFSIQGAMETEKEVREVYKAYGKPEDFGRAEDDSPHESTKKNREAMYAFFQKHLKNPGDPSDLEIALLSPEEMRITGSGQVSTSLGGETVFTLNRKESEQLEAKLKTARADPEKHFNDVLRQARVLSGFREPSFADEPVFSGRYRMKGYTVEKYFVKGEGNYIIPYLLMMPNEPAGKALIYLHPDGKNAASAAGGEMEWFVKRGFAVLAPDLVGTGEMGPGDFRGDAYIEGGSHNLWYLSMLIGRSIAGIRAGDVVKLTSILKQRTGIGEVYGLSRKEMASVLIHAAAFDPSISRVALISPCTSYRSIVMNRFYNSSLIPGAVPGALKAYDLTDLAATLAPRTLIMAGVTDGYGKTTDSASVNYDLAVIKTEYNRRKAGEMLKIVPEEQLTNPDLLYRDLIK